MLVDAFFFLVRFAVGVVPDVAVGGVFVGLGGSAAKRPPPPIANSGDRMYPWIGTG